MAYDPMLYNPYGSYMPRQQAVNGLNFIDGESDLDSLRMPPGSVSQPYFLKDSNRFIVVTFDNIGGSTREYFTFDKEIVENPNEAVTDVANKMIGISWDVLPPLLDRVLLHEIGHALTWEYGFPVNEGSAHLIEGHSVEAVALASSLLGRPVCVGGMCLGS